MFGYLVSRMLPIVPKTIVHSVAKRYVAGETVESAIDTVRRLNARGWSATVDILGEDAHDLAHADATVAGYKGVLDALARDRLDANVSVKLTHLGLRLDAASAEARIASVIEHAKGQGSFVRIDMEDSPLTQTTLDLHGRMKDRFGAASVGTVIQAYLRRTVDDARTLGAAGASLRLCKGIYREPKAIAFKGREEIRASYLAAAEALLTTPPGARVGFATHDRQLVARILELVDRLQVPRDRFEFQALLGVPVEDLLDDLVRAGHKVRIYVPYGEEWYPYSTRRLKENPKLATYVVGHMFRPSRAGQG